MIHEGSHERLSIDLHAVRKPQNRLPITQAKQRDENTTKKRYTETAINFHFLSASYAGDSLPIVRLIMISRHRL